MRNLAVPLLLVLVLAGCTSPDDAPPTPSAPTVASTPTATPEVVTSTPPPAATPATPTATPATPTATPSATPAPDAPAPSPMRLEKSFAVEIPAAVENDAAPPIYTKNCVRVEGAETTRLVDGTANATWSAAAGSATTLDLIANVRDGNITRVTGSSPLSLVFDPAGANSTDVALQLPQGTPAAALQQTGTIALTLFYLGPEPTMSVGGCTVRVAG